MKETYTVYLGTGTNLGNREENLNIANRLITERLGPIIRQSKIYKTAAWGITDQPDFFNQVIVIQTSNKPQEVLQMILNIELEMGRQRIRKWGSRLIDIDILFFEDQIIDEANLKIPHPYIASRNFVLMPMAEIAPNFMHPVSQMTIQQMLEVSEDMLNCESI